MLGFNLCIPVIQKFEIYSAPVKVEPLGDSAEDTYYFDKYDVREAWKIDPKHMVDGNIETYAKTGTQGAVELCNGNTYTGGGSGTITKVELRAYCRRSGTGDIYLRPVFGGITDGGNYELDIGADPAWSSYQDITSDPNAPSWTWTEIANLDCDVDAFTIGMLANVDCYKVEIKVIYSAPSNDAPTQSTQIIWNATTNDEKKLNTSGIDIYPTCFNVTIADADADYMNVTILTNESGPWTIVNQTASGMTDGTYCGHNTSWVDTVNATYWISFNISDDSDWCNETYHFYTGNKFGLFYLREIGGIVDHDGTLLTNNSDTMEELHCTMQVWWNLNEIITPNYYGNLTIDNIYYHVWYDLDFGCPISCPGDIKYMGYNETEVEPREYVTVNLSTTDNKSSVYGNHNITLGCKVLYPTSNYRYIDTNDGDDIYRFNITSKSGVGCMMVWTSPHNQSFIIFNIDDNATLNVTDSDGDGLNDYEELWTTWTNPYDIDTDDDGVSDYNENISGSDPNDYTDTIELRVWQNIFSGWLSGGNIATYQDLFSGWLNGGNIANHQNLFSGYLTGGNSTGYQELFSGYLSGGNYTVFNDIFSGYLTGGNDTIAWNNLFSGYLTGGDIGAYQNILSGYLTGGNNTIFNDIFIGYLSGGNVSGYKELFSGWLSGGNASIKSWQDILSGYLSGGNDTITWNNLFSGYLTGGDIPGYQDLFSGWLTGGNYTIFNDIFSGYLTGGNITIYQDLFSGWLSGGNISNYKNIFSGWLTGGSDLAYQDIFTGYLSGGNNTGYRDIFMGWLTGGNISMEKAWKALFYGYLSGGNISGYEELFSGWLTGGNTTTTWKDIFSGYLTGGNSAEYQNIFSGYLTGGDIGTYQNLFSGWLTGGNTTVRTWKDMFSGYLSGGNDTIAWKNLLSGWLTGGDMLLFQDLFSGYLAGGNTSIWNHLFSGYLSGGNISAGIFFNNEDPTNGSFDIATDLIWSVDISSTEGTFNWSINCSNGQSNNATDDSDGTKNVILIGLEYDTEYIIWVNVTDAENSKNAWYTFTTELGMISVSFTYIVTGGMVTLIPTISGATHYQWAFTNETGVRGQTLWISIEDIQNHIQGYVYPTKIRVILLAKNTKYDRYAEYFDMITIHKSSFDKTMPSEEEPVPEPSNIFKDIADAVGKWFGERNTGEILFMVVISIILAFAIIRKKYPPKKTIYQVLKKEEKE